VLLIAGGGRSVGATTARLAGRQACGMYLVFAAWLPMIPAELDPHNNSSFFRE